MPTSPRTTHPATVPRLLTYAPRVERTKAGLLALLDAVDVEGWNGHTATALLNYVRTDLIRPLAIDVGLRGAAASQAEATAWEAVWLQLCAPSLRSAKSPWGVIWQTARRALLGEILAARWGTNWRRAWEQDANERQGCDHRPLSIECLAAVGTTFGAAALEVPGTTTTSVSTALDAAAGALASAGWDDYAARQIVGEIASMEDALGHDATIIGWRTLATRLGLPPWQARRLTAVLRGTVERPGLLARLIREGHPVLNDSSIQDSLASTRARSSPSPTGRKVVHGDTHRQQLPAVHRPSPPVAGRIDTQDLDLPSRGN